MYTKYAILRDKKGMSDYQVSKEIDVKPNTISDWKTGKTKMPRVEVLIKLSNLFGVPLDYWREG